MSEYQVGAFPVTSGGKVVLIQNKDRSYWIFPKGHCEKGKKDRDVVEMEAFEEAGLIGRVEPEHRKFKVNSCKADYLHIYLMRVKKVKDRYPEQQERKRMEVSLKDAEKYLKKDLHEVLKEMSKHV
ncbi:NUDIX domain-containing protein [Kiritimatiellaeota bacterium B1221]|nr:NUDIX domain-containing protein [Kiritimatiellaeota bacterium B1221]